MDYSFPELADMHFVYGLADGNANKAARIYQERFPNRRHPNRKIFVAIAQRLRDTGSLKPEAPPGKSRSTRSVEFEESVLECVRKAPEKSTRAIARELHVDRMSVWRVLNEEGLHPFHLRQVQELTGSDFERRVHFCSWFMHKCAENPNFSRHVLFTDEACFTRNGYFNSRNSHMWDTENPHATAVTHVQNRFSINVWAGIIDDYIVGPYLLPSRLTGNMYVEFLEETLPQLLEDIPLSIRRIMWFQSDGAPAHFTRRARECVREKFPNKWIGRGSAFEWPPRSPDLTPLDFFLWGHLKALVYEKPFQSPNELFERIVAACDTIRNTTGIFSRVRESLQRRLQLCVSNCGRQFEQLL
ncbi:histone-lysine N-methyltransferase SETMAR-like [Prorops nasuta]|uniref:histone-lysine N-methyltransferase SETMAR-like n=1 Tax=Prorops nasuta TaxID=863751 RepID=UPI0034CF8448